MSTLCSTFMVSRNVGLNTPKCHFKGTAGVKVIALGLMRYNIISRNRTSNFPVLHFPEHHTLFAVNAICFNRTS